MAEGLNRATLIGNLGAEPELRYTNNNRAVLKFRIATTESYKDGDGERKEVTHWHSIVLWGNRGEALSKILVKGMQVYVEGRIEHRSYDDKDGIKRNITEISATNVILVGRRGDSDRDGAERGGGGARGNSGPPGNGNGNGRREKEEQRMRPGKSANDDDFVDNDGGKPRF